MVTKTAAKKTATTSFKKPAPKAETKTAAPKQASTVEIRENQDGTSNMIVRNVVFFWVKIVPDQPHENPYGKTQWEMQIRMTARSYAKNQDMLESLGKAIECADEEYEGWVQINVRKTAEKSDGSAATPVKVWDEDGNTFDEPGIIGNGSKGDVKVYLRAYQVKHPKTGKVTKEGVSCMLTGVKVMELVEYRAKGGGFDFNEEADDEGDDDGDEEI